MLQSVVVKLIHFFVKTSKGQIDLVKASQSYVSIVKRPPVLVIYNLDKSPWATSYILGLM